MADLTIAGATPVNAYWETCGTALRVPYSTGNQRRRHVLLAVRTHRSILRGRSLPHCDAPDAKLSSWARVAHSRQFDH